MRAPVGVGGAAALDAHDLAAVERHRGVLAGLAGGGGGNGGAGKERR